MMLVEQLLLTHAAAKMDGAGSSAPIKFIS